MVESTIPPLGLINIITLHISSTWEKFLEKFQSRFSKRSEFTEAWNVGNAKGINKLELSNGETGYDLSREDVELVMAKLNFLCNNNNEEEKFCVDDISTLFEEKEPSIDEVEEAFYVFDENKDGFIDAEELKSVLRVLGLGGGLDMETCRAMIERFDENADGKIDLDEFVKLLEISLG